MIYSGDSSIADVKYGSQQVDKVYHGSNLVWQQEKWDGDYVYLRAGSAPGYAGDILLGGSGGLLYDTGSSNPNYDNLLYINKYGFRIETSATEMATGYSLLNLFDGQNDMGSYAYVGRGDPSSRLIAFSVYMPFNQWELTQVGYWEGIFSDTTDFVNEIYFVPPNEPNEEKYVVLFKEPPSRNTLQSFSRSDSFNGGDPATNRFILGLVTVAGKRWHYYTDIIFELKIPYTEYKAWKQQCHVPVKIEEKTINNETIGTIVKK